jgi:hypothetical protein
MQFTPVRYQSLNAKQKENYNYHKVAAVLADFGYTCIRLTDDWQGADFIAQHIDGQTFLKVQLKTRLTFNKKYEGCDLFVAFQHDGHWYLYPHDTLLKKILKKKTMGTSNSWAVKGSYSFPHLSIELLTYLRPYRISPQTP